MKKMFPKHHLKMMENTTWRKFGNLRKYLFLAILWWCKPLLPYCSFAHHSVSGKWSSSCSWMLITNDQHSPVKSAMPGSSRYVKFLPKLLLFLGWKGTNITHQGRSKGKAIDNHPTSFFQASRWKWPFPDLKGDFTYKNAIIPLCHHHFLRTKRAKKHPGRLTAGTYPEDHLPRPIIWRFHLLMFGAFTNPKQALHCTSSACVGSRCSSSARACAWSKKFPPCKPQIQKKKPAGY